MMIFSPLAARAAADRLAHFLKYRTKYTIHLDKLGKFPFTMGCLNRSIWPILAVGRQT
jgi:hypothetical protein